MSSQQTMQITERESRKQLLKDEISKCMRALDEEENDKNKINVASLNNPTSIRTGSRNASPI